MTLYYEEEGDVNLPLDGKDLAETVIKAALLYAQCPYESEVNLLLTQNEMIQSMNKEFRGIDSPTDVLSFPTAEYRTPGDFSALEEQQDCFDPESGELLLGDIVISKDKVLEQAEEFGHSVKREYAFLMAHSMLHLFGYDHIDENERAIMEEKQNEILDQLKIWR